MHIVFAATGCKHHMDLWEKYMETATFPFPYIDHKDGDKKKVLGIQGQLRPLRLYEYIFPRDSLNLVLNTLQFENNLKSKNLSLSNAYLEVLRRALKLKKIPNIPQDQTIGKFPMYKENVRIIGIGMHEDADLRFTFNDTDVTQEGI